MINFVRAMRIYQNPVNLKEDIRCDLLYSDGVIEHYDWNSHSDQKKIKAEIDSRTIIYDERPDKVNMSWESYCKFYGANI